MPSTLSVLYDICLLQACLYMIIKDSLTLDEVFTQVLFRETNARFN